MRLLLFLICSATLIDGWSLPGCMVVLNWNFVADKYILCNHQCLSWILLLIIHSLLCGLPAVLCCVKMHLTFNLVFFHKQRGCSVLYDFNYFFWLTWKYKIHASLSGPFLLTQPDLVRTWGDHPVLPAFVHRNSALSTACELSRPVFFI